MCSSSSCWSKSRNNWGYLAFSTREDDSWYTSSEPTSLIRVMLLTFDVRNSVTLALSQRSVDQNSKKKKKTFVVMPFTKHYKAIKLSHAPCQMPSIGWRSQLMGRQSCDSGGSHVSTILYCSSWLLIPFCVAEHHQPTEEYTCMVFF